MGYPIVICEDQIIQLNQLETIIKNFILFHDDLFSLQLKTQSPTDVEEYLDKFNPTQGIYFLDIDLNHATNGIDLAEQIRAHDVQAKIIFTTTHDEMIPLTMQRRIEALGFISKDQPLEDYRTEVVELIILAQQRIDESRINQNKAFIFSLGSQKFTIPLGDIYFLESSDLPHRVKLYTKNGQYEFYGQLSDLEKEYPIFFRISRSCLANLKSTKEINFKTREIFFEDDFSRFFSLGKASKIKEFMKIDEP